MWVTAGVLLVCVAHQMCLRCCYEFRYDNELLSLLFDSARIFTACQLSCGKVIFQSCLSVHSGGPRWPLSMMHWNFACRDHCPPPPSPGPIQLDMFKLVQLGPHCTGTPLIRTCSNLFTVKHVRLKSGRLASYWNAFFCVHNARGSIITQTSGELIAQKPVHNHCQYVNTCVAFEPRALLWFQAKICCWSLLVYFSNKHQYCAFCFSNFGRFSDYLTWFDPNGSNL